VLRDAGKQGHDGDIALPALSKGVQRGESSVGLTIVVYVAIVTGPALLGSRGVLHQILFTYLFFQNVVCVRSQYLANFAISSNVSEDFQLNAVCVQKFLFDSFSIVT